MNTAVKLALIGAGKMGREHLRAFKDVAGVELTGIHSRTRAKAEGLAREFGVPHVCDSIADLHAQTRADLVVISVSDLSARAVMEASLQFPWAVFMEKPPGINCVEANAIQLAASRAGRRVWVGLNRRFLSSTQAVLTDLAAREGSRYVHATDQQSLAAAARIGHPPALITHWMYANSIHVLDLLRCFSRGKLTRVEQLQRWNPQQPGTVLVYLAFDSGDSGLYEGFWGSPGPWAVAVNTRPRRWELRPLEQAQFQNAQERGLHSVPSHPWDTEFKPGFRAQADAIVRAVQNQPSAAVTLDQALETMALIQAIFET